MILKLVLTSAFLALSADEVVNKVAESNTLIAPLLQVGVAGVCLIGLAAYYVRKDTRYEKRIDEMREMEKAFRAEQSAQQEKFRLEQAAMIEKYRVAMEKVASSLDVIIATIKKN